MSSSVDRRRKLVKTGLFYVLIALFCAVFGAVYELFSHGVYSYRMIYAFIVPLVLGAVFFLGIALRANRFPSALSTVLWNFGVAALTIGMLFHGVLSIYGTTNQWIIVYYIAAGILLTTGIVSYLHFDKKTLQLVSEDAYEVADCGR